MPLDHDVSRHRFLATAIREGIYRFLVLYKSGGASKADVYFAFDKSPSLKSIPNSREILNNWLKGLGNPERSARPKRTRSTEQEKFEENDTPFRSPRPTKKRGLDRQRELDRVVSAQTQIESLLKEGKVDWAIENTRSLIEEQVEKSGSEYACKTLSSLAASAQELGMHKLQLEWAREAVSLNPDDPVAATQVAHAMLKNGEMNMALHAYEQVIEQFPGDVVAKNGRAETLRSLGKYAHALEAYEQVIEQFPGNVVAKSGRAETLRSLGKYADALEAYEQVIEQFPGNLVAKTGRVCVLVDQKEYDRALMHLESRLGPSPVLQTQDDWIDFHVRAMIRLKKGDLALAAQDMRFGLQHCQFAKSKAYFASGLAIVQMKQNAPQDALQTMTKENSFLPVPQLIRGLVLCENLDIQTAVSEIDQLDDRVPFIHEICHEMKLKYVDKSPASKSTDWILGRLSDLLLAA